MIQCLEKSITGNFFYSFLDFSTIRTCSGSSISGYNFTNQICNWVLFLGTKYHNDDKIASMFKLTVIFIKLETKLQMLLVKLNFDLQFFE